MCADLFRAWLLVRREGKALVWLENFGECGELSKFHGRIDDITPCRQIKHRLSALNEEQLLRELTQ